MKQNQRDLIELVKMYLYEDPSVPTSVYIRRSGSPAVESHVYGSKMEPGPHPLAK